MRDATHHDIPRMVELGAVMHAESRFAPLRYLPEKVAGFLGHLIDNPNAFVRVVEARGEVVGGLVAMAVQHWFSDAWLSQDIAMFLHPDHRGGMTAARLIRAYQEWAHGRGIVDCEMGVNTGVKMGETGLLMQRMGFAPVGALYSMNGGGHVPRP